LPQVSPSPPFKNGSDESDESLPSPTSLLELKIENYKNPVTRNKRNESFDLNGKINFLQEELETLKLDFHSISQIQQLIQTKLETPKEDQSTQFENENIHSHQGTKDEASHITEINNQTQDISVSEHPSLSLTNPILNLFPESKQKVENNHLDEKNKTFIFY
jgi:hypothetical protein